MVDWTEDFDWTVVAPQPSAELAQPTPVTLPGFFSVGQGINVAMQGAVSEQWNWPPSGIVTGYVTTGQLGQLYGPPAPFAMNPTIYFTAPGTYNFTSVAVYPNGTQQPFIWAFVITMPQGQIQASFPGAANYYPNPDRIALGQADPTAAGIEISGVATNVTPVDGYLAFLQLVTPMRYVSAQQGQPARPCPSNGQVRLDANCATGLPFYYGSPVALGRGLTTSISLTDIPSITLSYQGIQAYSAGVQNESFQTCLVFMPIQAPTCAPSIWIPLAQVNWNWTCNAYLTAGGYVSFGVHTQSAVVVQPSFPQWTANICDPANTAWGQWNSGSSEDIEMISPLSHGA